MKNRNRFVLVATLCFAAQGCAPPSVAIEYVSPLGIGHAEMDATVALYALGEQSPVRCQDLAFSDLDPTALESSLTFKGPLDPEDRAFEIPRIGQKLLLAEARDEAGDLVASGCLDIGPLEGDETLSVQMIAATTLALDPMRSLTATVPRGGSAPLSSDVVGTALDFLGRPRANAEIRFVVSGPGGVEETETLVSDVNGRFAFSGERNRAGGFSIAFTPRVARRDEKVEAAGFATPDDIAVVPFGSDRPLFMVPISIDNDSAAFIALVDVDPTETVAAELKIARPIVAPGVATTFRVETLEAPTGGWRPIGVVRDPASGLDVPVLQRALSKNVVVFATDGPVEFAVPGNIDLEVGVALGPCENGRFSLPLATGFFAGDDRVGTRVINRLVLFDFENQPRQRTIANVTLFGSFCVADEGGEQHRVLALRGGNGKVALVDFGPGIEDLDTDFGALDNAIDQIGIILGIGQSLEGEDSRILLGTVSTSTSSILVSAHNLAPAETNLLSAESESLMSLPGLPRQIGAGALSGPDRLEPFSLVATSAEDEEQTRQAGLLFIGSDSTATTVTEVGTIELDSCRPVSECLAVAGDVDGDGALELLVGRATNLLAYDPEAAGTAELVRLAP